MSLVQRKLYAALVASVSAVLALPARAADIPDPAKGWDELWHHVALDLLVIGVVFGFAAIYMLLKYRASSPDEVGQGPKLTRAQGWAWALIPAAVFMADDFFLSAKGWSLWNIYRKAPENALEIKVTGYQWFWEFDYGNGVRTQELKVPVGRPVVLRMTAVDVIHSFFMPAYKVKEDVMPGRVTWLWFLPNKPGKVVATCTEFCGSEHAKMYTYVEAVPVEQFSQWLDTMTKQAQAEPAGPKKKV